MKRDVFQAIADPTRRAIIFLLAANAMTPNAIATHFDCSRQAVSKHIQILVECDVVLQEQRGREIFYHVRKEKMEEVEQWLAQFKTLIEKRFSQLDEVLAKLQGKK